MPNGHKAHLRLSVPVNSTDHVLGSHFAAVTIVEYGDYECPDSKRAYPAVRQMAEHFGHRIGFIYRHFPLTQLHPNAERAAEAAEAAASQGKFWEMHARLFAHHGHLDAKHLHAYAQDLDLDMPRYDAETGDHIYRQRIQEHVEGGRRSGVQGTPAFFLNGVRQDSSAGLGPLLRHIEMALAGHPHP